MVPRNGVRKITLPFVGLTQDQMQMLWSCVTFLSVHHIYAYMNMWDLVMWNNTYWPGATDIPLDAMFPGQLVPKSLPQSWRDEVSQGQTAPSSPQSGKDILYWPEHWLPTQSTCGIRGYSIRWKVVYMKNSSYNLVPCYDSCDKYHILVGQAQGL